MLIVLATLILVSFGLTRPGFANVPSIVNVVVWNSGGSTKLNVTVLHTVEVTYHYVDILNVTIGSDLPRSFPQSSPHTLDPVMSTFNVTLDLGVIADTPTTTVQAHCNVHGWSVQNWTGSVPEFPIYLFLLTLLIGTSVSLAKHRIRSDP